MKNNIFLIMMLFCLTLANKVLAQQRAQYSMYMNNNYVLNPAVGGTTDYTEFKALYRNQWTGFEGTPKSIFLTGHTSIGKQLLEDESVKPMPFHGVGGYIFRDDTGPTKKIALFGSYAYHLPLTTKLTLSMGAFAGFQHYSVQKDLDFYTDSDPALSGQASKLLPDIDLGAWLYHKNYYVGIASFQVLNNKINFEDIGNTDEDGKLNNHFFLSAGYRVQINEDFMVVPSFVMRGVYPAPVQFDINAKVRYKDFAWAGISYRNKDAIVALIGATIKSRYEIGYAYDFTTSNLKYYSGGSHEIMIGYRIPHDAGVEPTTPFW